MLRSTLMFLLTVSLTGVAAATEGRVDRFLATAGQTPVWTSARLEALATAIEELADDGLAPSNYDLDAIRRFSRTRPTSAAERSCIETRATRAWLAAVDDLAYGRLAPLEADPMWRIDGDPLPTGIETPIASALAGLDDPDAALDAARPAHRDYLALRAAHAWLRGIADAEPAALPAGSTLRAGDAHARVAVVRARLAWLGYTSGDILNDYMDTSLEEAVRAFQRDHALETDGVVGPRTRAALNLDADQRLARVRANLERWRQLAGDLRDPQVRVDTGAATVTLVRDGRITWLSRVQVGRRDRPTPLLRSNITRLTFNPPWYVPPTILRQDKLPEIRDNPDALEQGRLRVFAMDGTELDPATVDWNEPGAIRLRQDPGPHNALGQVALRFPNPYSVYLHDTPSQQLFSSWQRTFSSGCVRVERAVDLAEALLGNDGGPEQIATWLAHGRTREVNLSEPVSILITYFGAGVEDGRLQLRPDVYGHDARIIRALDADADVGQTDDGQCALP